MKTSSVLLEISKVVKANRWRTIRRCFRVFPPPCESYDLIIRRNDHLPNPIGNSSIFAILSLFSARFQVREAGASLTSCNCAVINNGASQRCDSVFHVISHTALICSTRVGRSGAFYSNFRLHPIQFHLLFRTPSPAAVAAAALSCLYDKWNERFRSRSQRLRVVDIKDCQEEFPFYYRAKAAAKFKSSQSRILMSRCVVLGLAQALREDCSSKGISVSHKRRQVVSRHSFVAAPLAGSNDCTIPSVKRTNHLFISHSTPHSIFAVH